MPFLFVIILALILNTALIVQREYDENLIVFETSEGNLLRESADLGLEALKTVKRLEALSSATSGGNSGGVGSNSGKKANKRVKNKCLARDGLICSTISCQFFVLRFVTIF